MLEGGFFLKIYKRSLPSISGPHRIQRALPRYHVDCTSRALAKALKDGVIQGAALDVFEKEPLPADSPLRDPAIEERMRLFPHFASAGRITRLSPDPKKGMAGRCVQAVIDVLEGNYDGNPAAMPYVVNKEAFQ